MNINCSEEAVWISPSWQNNYKETTTKGHQYEEGTCLGQEIQAMDIRPVEICHFVWWVQILDFWFQPPCLCETQSRWTDDFCMCVSHLEAWKRRCDVWGCFAGDTVCDLFRIQGALNQHGYHSILQRYAIPSGFGLSGTIICFSTGQWPNTPPDCVRAILPRRKVRECCFRWPGLRKPPPWFGMNRITE